MVLYVLCCIRRRGVETSDGAVSVCDGAQTSATLFRGSVTHPPPSLKWNPSVSKEMYLFATHILGLAVSV